MSSSGLLQVDDEDTVEIMVTLASDPTDHSGTVGNYLKKYHQLIVMILRHIT